MRSKQMVGRWNSWLFLVNTLVGDPVVAVLKVWVVVVVLVVLVVLVRVS